jgi:hypothetical protein
MRAAADRLLKGKGQVVKLYRNTTGTYNPATGGVANTTTMQEGYGAVIDWDARQIDGTLILATDKRLLLSALNAAGATLTAPALGDTVTIGGVVYTLVAPLKTVSPGGTSVLYDCNLRA